MWRTNAGRLPRMVQDRKSTLVEGLAMTTTLAAGASQTTNVSPALVTTTMPSATSSCAAVASGSVSTPPITDVGVKGSQRSGQGVLRSSRYW